MTDGTCSEQKGGIHQICAKNIGSKNFSEITGQGDWSNNVNNRNHCLCLGAWANYVAKSDLTIDLKCDSIPDTVFSPNNIKNWACWNDVSVNGQAEKGLKKLYQICWDKANKTQRKHLEQIFKTSKFTAACK